MKTRIKTLFFLLLLGASSLGMQAQNLNLPAVIQEQTEWCWAASTKVILNHYGLPIDQCTIAEYARSVITWHNFGTDNCCSNPNAGCNYWNYNWGYPGSMEDILSHYYAVECVNMGTYMSLQSIQNEVTAGHPFLIRWGWNSGGGHFMVGYGVAANDIYYNNSLVGYGAEISDYNWMVNDGGSHTWTHSQTTCVTPTAAFSTSSNLLAVTFTDQTAGSTGWLWDFGDGQSSTAQNPTHTYATSGTYVACLRARSGTCSDITCDTIAVTSVAIQSPSAFAVAAYPNPSTGIFQLQLDRAVDARVYDLQGRTVLTQHFERGQNAIDLSGNAAGVYFMDLTAEDAQTTLKLVVMQH